MFEQTKLRAGNQLIDVTLEYKDKRVYFHFPYNAKLIDEIKTSFEGRKYHGFDTPPRKIWSAPITQRNKFRLEYLKDKYGSRPYARFDTIQQHYNITDIGLKLRYPLYLHQIDLVNQALSARWFLWAAEMGLGKTLAAFCLIELADFIPYVNGKKKCWWVGPKSALRAVNVDYYKWKPDLDITWLTYDGMKSLIKNWKPGTPAPQVVIFDESHKLKTPGSQRSKAAKHLADSIRDEWGSDSIIGLMTGTPAPKNPADWYWQCEIACPGFLREANEFIFKQRLGVIEQRENVSGGGVYPHLVTWLDDENKCSICGQLKEHRNHIFNKTNNEHQDYLTQITGTDFHIFEPSVNEVSKLARRMNGLVIVKMKKDCLDLPDKIYEIIECKPSADTLRAAQLITAKSTRAIEALTLLRELSDGFQYSLKVTGKTLCQRCHGKKEVFEYFDPDDPDGYVDQEFARQGLKIIYDEEGFVEKEVQINYDKRLVECPHCHGTGETDSYKRTVIEVPTPKTDVLIDQLELHEDIGRLNVYAGFTASIDRIIKICHQQDWGTIRVDGRGWQGLTPNGEYLPDKDLLAIYSDTKNKLCEKIAFVGQAGSAGVGLTLTASPTTFFYSNDFNGESRMQAEDRGHRIGMDRERGGHIVDCIHLDSDRYILENIKKKKDLARMSMTGLKELFT